MKTPVSLIKLLKYIKLLSYYIREITGKNKGLTFVSPGSSAN